MNPRAYEPDFAGSLHNFAVDLGNSGDREQARLAVQQAVEIYTRLAETSPAMFASNLERSQHLLASLS